MQEECNNTLSVSIVCYKTPIAELVGLLGSLATALSRSLPTRSIVYLIDNSEEGDLSSKQLSADLPGSVSEAMELRLMQGHGNIGFGRGHNLVLPSLDTKFHLVLNPDVILDEGCLSAGIEFMELNADVVIASPESRSFDSSKQYLCKQYPSVLTFLVRGFLPKSLDSIFARRLAKYEMHHLSDTEANSDIPIVSGCYMLCRTSALQELGGFDQRYFLYFEDFDLSLRMRKLGKLAYVPAMKIQHGGGYAAKKGFAHLKMFARSGLRFYNTHGWHFFQQSG